MERRGAKNFGEVEAAFEGLRSQRDAPPGFSPDDFLPQLQYSVDGGKTVDRLQPTISAMVQADVRQNDASSDFFDISVKFSTTRFILSRSLEDFYGLHNKLKVRVLPCANTLPPLPTAKDVRNATGALKAGHRPGGDGSVLSDERKRKQQTLRVSGQVISCKRDADQHSSATVSLPSPRQTSDQSFFSYLFPGSANARLTKNQRESSLDDADDDTEERAVTGPSMLKSQTGKPSASSFRRAGNVVTRKLRSYLSQVIDWFRARRVYDPDVLEFLDLDADLLLRLHREDMRVVRNIVVSWGGHVAHALPLPWVSAFVQSITPHRRHGALSETTTTTDDDNNKNNNSSSSSSNNNNSRASASLPARHQPGPIELRKLLDDGPALATTSWALVTKPAWIVLSTVYGADIDLDIDTLRKLLLDHSISANQVGLDQPPTSLLGLPVGAP